MGTIYTNNVTWQSQLYSVMMLLMVTRGWLIWSCVISQQAPKRADYSHQVCNHACDFIDLITDGLLHLVPVQHLWLCRKMCFLMWDGSKQRQVKIDGMLRGWSTGAKEGRSMFKDGQPLCSALPHWSSLMPTLGNCNPLYITFFHWFSLYAILPNCVKHGPKQSKRVFVHRIPSYPRDVTTFTIIHSENYHIEWRGENRRKSSVHFYVQRAVQSWWLKLHINQAPEKGKGFLGSPYHYIKGAPSWKGLLCATYTRTTWLIERNFLCFANVIWIRDARHPPFLLDRRGC